MSHSIKVYQPFFLEVPVPAFVHFARRFPKQFLCLRGLGAAKLFDFKIHGSPPNASTVDESSLFFGNHHYRLDVDFDYLAEILRGVIGDVKKLEGLVP